MWEIFKEELRYTRFAYFIFAVMVVFFVLLEAMSEDGERLYVLWFVIVMALNFWNAKRIREKRDYQLVQIPASSRDIGGARALMTVIMPAAYLVLYALLAGTIGRLGSQLVHLVFIYGLIVLIFALIFMFRDRFVGTRSLQQGKIVLIIAIAIIFGGVLALMLAADEAAETGAQAPSVIRAFDGVIRHDPLGNPLYVACFVAVSLVLAYASVITFQRRKTNVE
jgi:hypothetical protein